MRRRAAIALALLLQACLLGREEPEPEQGETLTVVPDDGPFDPSKALQDAGKGELEESPIGEGPKEERVATEGEARSRESAAERAVERIDAGATDDDQAKASVARNPPARDPGAGEPWWRASLDLALEAVIVIVLAFVVTLPLWLVLRSIGHLFRAARAHPRAVRARARAALRGPRT